MTQRLGKVSRFRVAFIFQKKLLSTEFGERALSSRLEPSPVDTMDKSSANELGMTARETERDPADQTSMFSRQRDKLVGSAELARTNVPERYPYPVRRPVCAL